MGESDIRAKFLRDHGQLRGKAAVLESLALGVIRGDLDLASALQLKGEDLHAHLLCHMQWEESELLPLFRAKGNGAGLPAEQLLEEHREQRERLEHSLASLRDSKTSPDALARDLLELVAWLAWDMAAEEAAVIASMDGGGEQPLEANPLDDPVLDGREH